MRENKLWSRIEIAARFILYGHAGCRIMSCERCGPTNILSVADSAMNEDIGPELKKKNVQVFGEKLIFARIVVQPLLNGGIGHGESGGFDEENSKSNRYI